MKVQHKEVSVLDIVSEYLKVNGYDGLFNEDAECGCEIGDLSPAGCISEECKAGYKIKSKGWINGWITGIPSPAGVNEEEAK